MSNQPHPRKKWLEYLGEFGGAFFISFYTIMMCWIYNRYDVLDKFSINGNIGVGWTLLTITFGATYLPVLFILLVVFSKTGCWCHFNPAVSISYRHAKGLSTKDTTMYIVVQMIGGVVAGLVLYILVSSIDGDKSSWSSPSGYFMGATETKHWGNDNNLWNYRINDGYWLVFSKMLLGFIVEAICFMAFMLLIFKVNLLSKNKCVIDVLLGAGLAIVIIIEIPFTGASLNPARSIGPVLFGSWGNDGGKLWIDYIQAVTGPICGGIMASYINQFWNKKLKK